MLPGSRYYKRVLVGGSQNITVKCSHSDPDEYDCDSDCENEWPEVVLIGKM